MDVPSPKNPREGADAAGNDSGAPQRSLWRVVALSLGAGLIALAGVAAYLQAGGGRGEPAGRLGYVGGAICTGCHTQEAVAWHNSHHALSMQHARDTTVLGDFNNATFTAYGVTSRFFRRDGKFFVNTDGRDGRMADFEVSYTFGLFPLQQYLVAFPNGRLL